MHVEVVDSGGESAEIDVCGTCGGVFFEFFDGLPNVLARATSKHRSLPRRATVVSAPAPCPDCQLPMDRVRFGESALLLLRCPGCMGLFATVDEARDLARVKHVIDLPEKERPWYEAVVAWLRQVW